MIGKINPPDINNAHVAPAMMTHTIPKINEIIDELVSLQSSVKELREKVAKLSVSPPPSPSSDRVAPTKFTGKR